MRTALIDGDILRYEVGSTGEDEDGIKSFDYVATVLDEKIERICEASESQRPVLFLTQGPTFRDRLAVTKPYKGQRDDKKPWHWRNLTVYMQNKYDVVETEDLEADDIMAIRQYRAVKCGQPDDTVICTRDKDLLMVPGWHYGWECGNQREQFLHFVTEEGTLEYKDKKLKGNGMAWFYAQLLMGDSTDNIPGAPGIGPAKAWKILQDVPPNEMFDAVRECYHELDCDDEYLTEQAQLLWMIRELDAEGNPVMWRMPCES